MKKRSSTLLPWSVKENNFPKSDSIVKKIKFLVRYGILAPSSFNTQPWKFQITENELLVFPEFTKTRKYIDPEDRELYISLGCSMTNIEVAAKYFGMMFRKTYGSKNDGYAAKFTFINGRAISQLKNLFEAITKRQTNRGEYTNQRFPKARLATLNKIPIDQGINLKLITNIDMKNQLGKMIENSDKIWFKNKEMVNELEHWLEDEVRLNNDGLPSGTLNLYKLAIEVKYILSGEPRKILIRAKRNNLMAAKSPLIVAISSEKDDKENWLKTGETFQKLMLILTSNGYASSFFNTVIQLPGQRAKLDKLLKVKGKTQLLFRVGKPVVIEPHTPRMNIEDVLVNES